MVECAQPSHELVATVECFYSRGPQAAMGCRGKQTKGQRKAMVFPQSDVTEEGQGQGQQRPGILGIVAGVSSGYPEIRQLNNLCFIWLGMKPVVSC